MAPVAGFGNFRGVEVVGIVVYRVGAEESGEGSAWRMSRVAELEAAKLEERRSGAEPMKQMSTALHDLCQPLTTLQCRLEMAELLGTPEAYREAVVTGMGECARLSAAVGAMRRIVRAAMQPAADEQIGGAE